jgi:dTDP-4-amino-4,6-dideoxygalactose transaminase
MKRSAFYVGRPNLGKRARFLERVNKILDSRCLSNLGPMLLEFEKRVAEILHVQHAVATCNATAAIEIASRALNLTGEVIVPSYTFVATAHALQWQGITPIFADIDKNTHNIDPSKIEGLITKKTSGIVGVHVWGRACDTEAIGHIATKHNLKLMYDASHGFGCSYNRQMLGSHGNCEIFSFHATKFINSFEGGVVTTNDGNLAYKMRMMTNFGITGYDRVDYLGINGKMNEVCAAMGLTNLEAMESIIAVNKRNYETYRELLKSIPGISVINYNPDERNNYQYVVIEVNPDLSPVNRDEIVEALHAKKVYARKYFWPGCHRFEPYRTINPNAGLLLPQTENLAAKVIVLPTGQTVSIASIKKICKIIHNAVLNVSKN